MRHAHLGRAKWMVVKTEGAGRCRRERELRGLHLGLPLEQGQGGFSRGPKINWAPSAYCQECSISNCWNKALRELMKELTLKANKRAHPLEAEHGQLIHWIWLTDMFHLAWVAQKTTETALENWEVSQNSRFVALSVSSPEPSPFLPASPIAARES